MSIWADEFTPTEFSELTFHPIITTTLSNLAQHGNIPHILFCGASGTGKKTRLRLLLRKLYGDKTDKVHPETIVIETPSQKQLEFPFLMSSDHMEINPSTLGIYDRLGIQKIMHETAQTQQLAVDARQKYKTIIIHDADSLTRDAMHSLRRTMEKYVMCIRIVLCCTYPSKIIPALRSRTLAICLSRLSDNVIRDCLHQIALEKNIDEACTRRIAEITNSCKGNLREAVMFLQTISVNTGLGKDVGLLGWERITKDIAENIYSKPATKTLLSIRSLFYELISHCIPVTKIIKSILLFLLHKEKGERWKSIVAIAAKYEVRAQKGAKTIYHLEAFAANVMVLYTAR